MINPGDIDTTYGEDGYAKIPGLKPQEQTNVHAVVQDPDGSFCICGTSPSAEGKTFLTRITQNGQWNDKTGHIFIPVSPDMDEGISAFTAVTRSRESGSYVAQSQAYYEGDGYFIETSAVGHYQKNLAPEPGFGNQGIILLLPDRPNAKEKLIRVKMQKVLRSEWVGNVIRTLYTTKGYPDDDEVTTWVALNNPHTGSPVEGLGDGFKFQTSLPKFDYGAGLYSLDVQQSHFLEDGSALVVGQLNDWYQCAVRLTPNGLYDTSFGLVPITGFRKVTKMAVDAVHDRIVFVAATPPDFGENVTIVKVHHLNGERDNSFNGNGYAYYFIESDSSTIRGVVIDDKQRIYIATHQKSDRVDRLFVTRLEKDGTLDLTFGEQGHAKFSDLYLDDLFYANAQLTLRVQREAAPLFTRLHI